MTLDQIVTTYWAAWSEKDEAARSAYLDKSWGDSGVYEDPMASCLPGAPHSTLISAASIRPIPGRRSCRPARPTTAGSISPGE